MTRPPGFVWDARMAMVPGLPVRVHDAYIAGQGMLHPAVLGLVSLAELQPALEEIGPVQAPGATASTASGASRPLRQVS